MTPSSGDVRRDLAVALDPVLTQSGATRVRRVRHPSWAAQRGEHSLACFVSLRVDSKATDPFAGGGFRVELERSRHRVPARALTGRALFFQLLTDEEMASLLAEWRLPRREPGVMQTGWQGVA